MMALILSTTSLGVVVPVLKEKNLTSGRYGQTILLASLIADFVTMLLITVLVAVISGGLTFEILLIGLLFVAFFLMYRFGDFIFNRIPRVRGLMDELSHATSQIKIRLAFTIMLSFVVLSEFLGTEIILGAFLAGAIISLLRQPEDAEVIHQMEAVGYGFFIPIFFIMVGVDFDLRAIISSPSALLLEPILLVSAILVKFVPTLLMRFSYSWRETLGAGALLSSRLSLIIAASAIGLRLGVISGPVNSDIILVAIITVTVAPLLFGQLVPDSKKEEPELVVVFGAGALGTEVGRQLQNHKEKVVLIDFDEKRVQKAQKFGLEVILGHVDQFDP
ncbi:MAG: sodium:proton antiporter, partial [Aliifodinibius sp.]|nr:sodium:proton antiporter [Fodinibius sp.]NIV13994.1 sodium:proton antiporter [Fodinibius sp.]NIY27837.1 sodium:proton antiporter [Fodinibius sp.]